MNVLVDSYSKWIRQKFFPKILLMKRFIYWLRKLKKKNDDSAITHKSKVKSSEWLSDNKRIQQVMSDLVENVAAFSHICLRE